MSRIAAVLCSAVLLSGCALPLPVQVAGWLLDGASVLTTDKTIADHGLSMVAGQDCSIWRGFRDGEVCRDERDGTLVAAASAAQPRYLGLTSPAVEMAVLAQPRRFPAIDGPFLTVK